MANEITYRGLLRYSKGDSDSFDLGEQTANMAGTKALRGRQTVTTTPEALVLGEVSAASAWLMVKNLDATNKVLIRPATGAAVFAEVQPGETSGPFRFASTVTAPFVESSAGSVDFIFLLVSA